MNASDLSSWRILDRSDVENILSGRVVLVRGTGSDERDKHTLELCGPDSWVIDLRYNHGDVSLAATFHEFQGDPVLHYNDPVEDSSELATLLATTERDIVIDITSLPTECLFWLLLGFKNVSYDRIVAVYVQPIEYRVERDDVLVPIFKLSEECAPISSIPGFIRLQDDVDQRLIVFMGFEGGRFQELYEHLLTDGDIYIVPVLPMPSYFAGWHMNGVYSNLETLRDSQIINSIKRVTSWDPFYALAFLESQYISYCSQGQLIVAPFGTKPHILASALFALKHQDVRIMYDHPRASKHRSSGVSKLRGYLLRGLL